MHISCTFCLRIKCPQMLLRGCATPPCVQQPAVSEQNLGSASTQKGVRIMKKGIKGTDLGFHLYLIFFGFYPVASTRYPPSLYVVDNVV